MTRSSLLIGLIVLASGGPVPAQTPDGETPANAGVCDELIGATPGLYGLCVAFCEAQDCEADFSQVNPVGHCKPSGSRLLELYDKSKRAGDPDMPCVQVPCPCWTEDDLDRFPVFAACRRPVCDDTACVYEVRSDSSEFVHRATWADAFGEYSCFYSHFDGGTPVSRSFNMNHGEALACLELLEARIRELDLSTCF